jgi:hypothetical protein
VTANLRSLLTNAESKVVQLARETQEKDTEIASLRMQIDPLKTALKASEERYATLSATIQAIERQQQVGNTYNDLRRKAESLLSESKLSSVEFQKLFTGEPSAEIQRLAKSETGDQDLSKIAFFLEMSSDRAPQLNLKSHLKDEPLTTDSNQPSDAEIQARAEKLLAATSNQRVVI